VQQQDVTLSTHAIGTVQAYATVAIKSRVDGQLLRVGFKDGDHVKKDQLLFQIDPRAYQIQVATALANLQKDEANLATAQSNLERSIPIAKKGYLSKQDFEQVKNNVTALAATVAADQAALTNAKLQLSYCTIYSPLAGRAGNLLVDTGNLIKANDTTPLVTINQIKPIYVTFNLPEENLRSVAAQLRSGPVSININIDKPKPVTLTGTLSSIDNSVDTTTGTITLKALLTNDQHYLWPGEFVKVSLPIAELQQALTVPTEAIQAGPNGSYVFIVENNKLARLKPVMLGAAVGNITVVNSGLKLQDMVITSGQLGITDGVAIQVVKQGPAV
jgi:multidrug efflux system membrane fusion protein